MAVIRGILAILIGVIVAGLIGVAIDYLRPSFIPNPMEYKYAWPYIFITAGPVSAVIAVALFGMWSGASQPAAKKREPLTKQRAKTKDAAKDKVTLGTSADVPGMPTFEVDRTKAADPRKKTEDKR